MEKMRECDYCGKEIEFDVYCYFEGYCSEECQYGHAQLRRDVFENTIYG